MLRKTARTLCAVRDLDIFREKTRDYLVAAVIALGLQSILGIGYLW